MKGPHGPKRPVSLSFIILYCVAFTSKPNTHTIVYIASIYIPVLRVITATLKPPKKISKLCIRIYRELFISKVDNWVGKTIDFDYLYHD